MDIAIKPSMLAIDKGCCYGVNERAQVNAFMLGHIDLERRKKYVGA